MLWLIMTVALLLVSRLGRTMIVDAFERTALIVVIGFFLLLVTFLIGAGVLLFDPSSRRQEDAAWLQMRIADRLRRDPVLRTRRILPTVQVPATKHASVIVEVSGAVPSEADRDAVLAIVREAALKLRRREVDIHDLIAVRRPAGMHVA